MSDPSEMEVKTIIEEPQEHDMMNMFASVWVKVEVTDNEDSVQYDPASEGSPDYHQGTQENKKLNQKPFQCNECDFTTEYKKCLQMHLLQHGNPKPFACNFCDYATKYQASFIRHLLMRHPTENKEELPKFNCNECDYKTLYKGNLAAHKRKHKSDKNFKCDLCSYATAYRHNYLKHSTVHNKVEVAYKCDKCPFVTKFEGHITRHLAKIHNEVSDKATKCEKCDYSTKVGWRLNIHKQRSLQKEVIKCTYCEFESFYTCESKKHKAVHYIEIAATKSANTGAATTTNIPTNLNSKPEITAEKTNHYVIDQNCGLEWSNIQVLDVPNPEKPFQCIMCEYSSKFKASVQRHYQRLHTDKNRPYKCTNCDFTTKTRDQITLHNKRSKSYEQLSCKSCSFTTFFNCQLIMHQKCHYTNKCTACDFVCRQKYQMEKHYTTFHLGKRLQCHFCDLQFSQKEKLLSHEITHTGKKPFICTLCDFKTDRRIMLSNHMRSNHNLEISPVKINDSKIQSLKVPMDDSYLKTIDKGTEEVNDLDSENVVK